MILNDLGLMDLNVRCPFYNILDFTKYLPSTISLAIGSFETYFEYSSHVEFGYKTYGKFAVISHRPSPRFALYPTLTKGKQRLSGDSMRPTY
jgi:hypothetical protein